ncbi:MgtC/SapB family protein [Sphingobium sp. BYY-5]|uniref:MgtC/SapB family protein n=1 Tax=Sphingobium sp. BYY-5 TaxID=2926400 RepID=UPI001FA738B1|nr:MgtC/SapB family protein [Sphingobium sp. BYY-5]MCI4592479.1 MgtC/SapB family protein [Sphingobium sp. BYY-5]
MVNIDAIGAIGLSLALGLLIGIQRGWALRNEERGSRFAGIRTFGLLGLVGGLAGAIRAIDGDFGTVLIAAAAILILLGYAGAARHGRNISGTASLVGLLTLGCGFLATTQQEMLATIIAVVVTLVLALRTQLHGWIGRLNEVEVNAIARFALIALVILPLLPDRAYGPLDAWNPRQLWMVVVMVSGFSFAGYVASKRLGASRGTIATAGAGAMVSSTAVTAALATRLHNDAEEAPILVAGIAAASTVMLLRVLILVGILAPLALPALALLVVPATLVSALATLWYLGVAKRHPAKPSQEVTVHNPFDIMPALALMALVMVLSLVSRWVLHRFGDAGLATVLALSGMVDVDSAIITMGGLPHGTLDGQTAGLILAVPVMLNTFVKAGVTISLAGWRRGWRAALPLVASVAAGLLMLPLVLGRPLS